MTRLFVSVLFSSALLLTGVVPIGTALAAPPNDDFADAQVVGPLLPVSVQGTNIGGTVEEGEPNHYGTNEPESSVWYRWKAPAAMKVTITFCIPGDTFYGQMAIYTGSAINKLTKISESQCLQRLDAVANETYSIAVEGYDDPRNFTFEIRPFAPPANDDLANATVIGPKLPLEVEGTTMDATIQPGESAGGGAHSVWYAWTAPKTGPVRIDACDYEATSGPGNNGLFIHTGGATIASLTKVGGGVGKCKVSLDVLKETTYKISFASSSDGEGNFTLKMLAEKPPANDNFATPQVVGPELPISVAGSTVFSTVEAGEPHHGNDDESSFEPHDSVWFSWSPSVSAEVRVRVCDADVHTRLGVYTGNAVGTLTRVTSSDPPIQFPYCSFRFDAEAGTTYRLAVGGSGDEEEGAFTLDIHRFARPANDDFANAVPIGPALPIAVDGTNIDASAEKGEPDHSGYEESPAYQSVWYSWTPAAAAAVRVSTCGAEFNSQLAVYTGNPVDQLTSVAFAEGGCGTSGGLQLAMTASAGTRYMIAVAGGYTEEEGPFRLEVIDPLGGPPLPGPPPETAPIGAKPSFNLRKALKKCRKIKKRKARKRCVRRARRKAKRINGSL